MVDSKQPDIPVVHGLAKNSQYEKLVIAILKNGRWTIEVTVKDQILTHPDVRDLCRTLTVQQRKLEHSFRQKLRKDSKKDEVVRENRLFTTVVGSITK